MTAGVLRAGGEAGQAWPPLGPLAFANGLAFRGEHLSGPALPRWQPTRIHRLAPDGAFETIVDDWTGEDVLTPTDTAFAGDDLGLLVLGGLPGWQLSASEPAVPGAPLARPVLP